MNIIEILAFILFLTLSKFKFYNFFQKGGQDLELAKFRLDKSYKK